MSKEWIVTDPLDHDIIVADGIVAETEEQAALEFINAMGYDLKVEDK